MKTLHPGDQFPERLHNFLTAFVEMDMGGTLIMSGGTAVFEDTVQRVAALFIEFDEEGLVFGFTCQQARFVAEVAEHVRTEHKCKSAACRYRGFRGLIGALREGANEAEREFKQQERRLN